MVVEIDTGRDTPEEIADKLAHMQEAIAQDNLRDRKSLAHLCGAVKWEEDALEYQKRLRDEWE